MYVCMTIKCLLADPIGIIIIAKHIHVHLTYNIICKLNIRYLGRFYRLEIGKSRPPSHYLHNRYQLYLSTGVIETSQRLQSSTFGVETDNVLHYFRVLPPVQRLKVVSGHDVDVFLP